jgi:hypothetical protein
MMDSMDAFVSSSEQANDGGPANVVDGLIAIARSLDRLATAVERLGLNDAGGTGMGAVELLTREIREGLTMIASAVEP